MSIIRTVHNRENPYVLINREALRDPNLSLRAKGLWGLCLSHRDDYAFHVKTIVKQCIEGRTAIYSAIKELIENNYALRIDFIERNTNGKVKGGGVEYIFFEFKISDEEKQKYIDEFKNKFQRSGSWNPGIGDSGNQPLSINDQEDVAKEVIIKPRSFEVKKEPAGGNNDPPDKSPKKASAAAGNNNSFDLSSVEEITPRQKTQFAKYPKEVVARAVKYCTHPDVRARLKGEHALIKQLHHFCKNPEDYKESFENLGKKPKKFSKETILARFKHGELYNGHEFTRDELGCGFLPSWGCGQGGNLYTIYWRNGSDFNDKKWKGILEKLGLKHE